MKGYAEFFPFEPEITEDGSSEDGSSEDGSSEDGSSEDGSSEDGSSEDGSSEDGSSEDGSAGEGSSEDGSEGDGSSGEGSFGFEFKKSLDDVFTRQIYDYYDNGIIPNEKDYQNIIYIDPAYSGDSDGSIQRPYRTLHDVPQKSNTAYLMKRGTSYVNNTGNHFTFNVGNVLLGAYGEGERPVIRAEGSGGIIFSKDNSTIRDIVVRYVQFGVHSNEIEGAVAFNVNMRSSWVWARNIRFIGCEVKGAGTNGIFIQQRDFSSDSFIEIGHTHVHKVNQRWTPTTNQWDASGDGIQITGFRGEYHIHNSIVDKSDVGNKFTIIVNAHNNGVNSVNGIIENCTLLGPMPQPDGGAILYFGNVNDGNQNNHHSIIVRNNFMRGSTYDGQRYTGSGIFSNSSKFEVYGNYIENCNNALRLGNELFGKNKVHDNTIIP